MNLIMQKYIKAILFDIGGTLVQKINHGYRDPKIVQQIVELLGVSCSPEEMIEKIECGQQSYREWQKYSFVELSPGEKWQRFLLKDLPAELVITNASKLQSLWSQSRGKRWLAPNALETLKELSLRGYKLATVSHTSPEYLMEIKDHNLFRTHLVASRFGKRKPHPAIFLAAAKECEVLPSQCAYVGDRLSRDVVGSREAGFGEVILVKSEHTTLDIEPCPMKADLVVSDISMLLDHFRPVKQKNTMPGFKMTNSLLYDGGLSTLNWDQNRCSLNDFFQLGRNLGFARFELNHQIPQSIFNEIDFDQFHFGTLHNPCPAITHMKVLEREDCLLTSLDDSLRRSAINVLKNTIETAEKLCARSVVIHSGWVKGDDSMDIKLRALFNAGLYLSEEYEQVKEGLIKDRVERGKAHLECLMKSMEEIIAFAKGSGILLGIENLMHYYELPIFSEMEELMKAFPQKNVGWQLDTGHLQIHQNLGLDSMQKWLDHFGDRLIGIHHHDVIGINDHLPPGVGNVDFDAISQVITPKTQITLEVKPQVTPKQISTGLKFLAEHGCITRLD